MHREFDFLFEMQRLLVYRRTLILKITRDRRNPQIVRFILFTINLNVSLHNAKPLIAGTCAIVVSNAMVGVCR